MGTINRKDYKGSKDFNCYTPDVIANTIFRIIQESGMEIKNIVDPSIGNGDLVKPFKNNFIYGIDINDIGKTNCNQFYNCDFEKFNENIQVDLVLSNPPFNGHPNRKLYPEVFLKKIIELWGKDIPIVMFVPSGFRLNQRIKSKRWKWLRNTIEISSILTLPLDIFPGVQFHMEVLFFNIKNIKPHYFLDAIENDDLAIAA